MAISNAVTLCSNCILYNHLTYMEVSKINQKNSLFKAICPIDQ